MGANILQGEADPLYPVRLSLWTTWLAEWDGKGSDPAVLTLAPLLRRVSTTSYSFEYSTMVTGGDLTVSSPWHADFFLRSATLLLGQWTGYVVRLCRRTFDWAEVLPFLEALLVTEVTGHGVTLSRRHPHAQRRTAYLLNAESTPESRRRLEAALRDANVYGLFVQRDKSHNTFWSSLADFTMFRQWFPLGEWKIQGSGEVFAVLSRVGLGSSWFPYLGEVPQRLATAGSRVAARHLSVQLPFNLLFGDTPPPTSVRTWTLLVGWLSQARTYAAMCRCQ